MCVVDAAVAIKTISKKKFLVNERSVTTTRVCFITKCGHVGSPVFTAVSRLLIVVFSVCQREIDIMKKLSSGEK